MARFAVAVAAMVALAFLIPLALTVREFARERAFTQAEQQAAAIDPVLVVTTDQEQLRRALASIPAGQAGRIAVHLPSGVVVGAGRADGARVAAAAGQGRAYSAEVPGGYAVLRPVVLEPGTVAVVEVYLLDGDLTRGLWSTWLVLGGVALCLVLISSLVADRLAARLVGATRDLAAVARTLGSGDLEAVADTRGPYELREVGLAFNAMAGRMRSMIVAEREFAADLSHRLRTPLTALRFTASALEDGPMADQARDVADWLEREVDSVISSARAGSGPREPAGCDAVQVLGERMAFWSALADDQGRRWDWTSEPGPCPVPVAPAELAAALDAILGNVFRHTRPGTGFAVALRLGGHGAGEQGRVGRRSDGTSGARSGGHPAGRSDGASGRSPGGQLVIGVGDAGPGIADPETALLRGHGTVREGSTGLGLDIVRRLAEEAGGTLRLGRSEQGGALVELTLPTGPAADPSTTPPGPRRRTAGLRRADRRGPRKGGLEFL